MKNILWLVTISFLFSCEQYDEIHDEELYGEYFYIKDQEHRSHLELRNDYTYYFNHAYFHSCELWSHYYGKWEVKNNKITLYEGIDLDSLIFTKRKNNINSDSIKIIFEDELLERFPKMRVKFEWDRKYQQIRDQQITFNKDSLYLKYSIHKSLGEVENKHLEYSQHRECLILTMDNYYAYIDFTLGLGSMKIGLKDFEFHLSTFNNLLEYKLKNGILISKGLTNRIYEHKIIQRDESAYFENEE